MILRIVRLAIQQEEATTFEELFYESYQYIRNFEGCTELKLMRDFTDSNIYFTYSNWESIDHLENYRKSDLFKSTWKKVKPLFLESAQVFTLENA